MKLGWEPWAASVVHTRAHSLARATAQPSCWNARAGWSATRGARVTRLGPEPHGTQPRFPGAGEVFRCAALGWYQTGSENLPSVGISRSVGIAVGHCRSPSGRYPQMNSLGAAGSSLISPLGSPRGRKGASEKSRVARAWIRAPGEHASRISLPGQRARVWMTGAWRTDREHHHRDYGAGVPGHAVSRPVRVRFYPGV